jgi:hypothetical protein
LPFFVAPKAILAAVPDARGNAPVGASKPVRYAAGHDAKGILPAATTKASKWNDCLHIHCFFGYSLNDAINKERGNRTGLGSWESSARSGMVTLRALVDSSSRRDGRCRPLSRSLEVRASSAEKAILGCTAREARSGMADSCFQPALGRCERERTHEPCGEALAPPPRSADHAADRRLRIAEFQCREPRLRSCNS